MKANEFIKGHGLDYAKGIIIACESGFLPKNQNYGDLKSLVESHELIKSHGGLDLSRKEAHKNCFEFNAPLLKAILDVESCQ